MNDSPADIAASLAKVDGLINSISADLRKAPD